MPGPKRERWKTQTPDEPINPGRRRGRVPGHRKARDLRLAAEGQQADRKARKSWDHTGGRHFGALVFQEAEPLLWVEPRTELSLPLVLDAHTAGPSLGATVSSRQGESETESQATPHVASAA